MGGRCLLSALGAGLESERRGGLRGGGCPAGAGPAGTTDAAACCTCDARAQRKWPFLHSVLRTVGTENGLWPDIPGVPAGWCLGFVCGTCAQASPWEPWAGPRRVGGCRWQTQWGWRHRAPAWRVQKAGRVRSLALGGRAGATWHMSTHTSDPEASRELQGAGGAGSVRGGVEAPSICLSELGVGPHVDALSGPMVTDRPSQGTGEGAAGTPPGLEV